MPQEKDKKVTDRTKLALNAALYTPAVLRTGKSIAEGIKFKGQVANATMPNPKWNKTTGSTEPKRIPVPNPKIDPSTGRRLPLTSPQRAMQTQAQVRPVGNALFQQAAREAILREAKSGKNPIAAAFTNARISMGGSGTPVTPMVGPQRRSVSPELQQELKAARTKMSGAQNLKDVRSVVEDMGDLGKKSILGMSTASGLGKFVKGVTTNPAFKAVSRYAPWLGPAISTAEYFASSNEAKNFADAKAKTNPGTGRSTNSTPPAANQQKKIAGSPEENLLIDKFNRIGEEIDADPYTGADQGKSKQIKEFIDWVNKNPQYIPIFKGSERLQAVIYKK